MRKKLGECLIQAGLITEDDLQSALTEHKRTGERLGAVLVRLNLATERQIAKALAYQLGFPYLNLAENPPDPSIVTLIAKDVALKRSCVAIRLDKNLLTVAMADPLLFSLVQDLEFQTGYRIKQVVATRADILESIAAGYPDKALMKTTPATGNVPATRFAQREDRRRRRRRADAPPGRRERRADRRPQGTQRGRADHRPGRSGGEERDQGRRLRHPRRADGEGRPDPPPSRRPAQGSDGPAQVGPRRPDRPPQDHGGHGHRREAAAAGRPRPRRQRRRQGHRLPRLDAAHAARREDGAARSRSEPRRAAARGARLLVRRVQRPQELPASSSTA